MSFEICWYVNIEFYLILFYIAKFIPKVIEIQEWKCCKEKTKHEDLNSIALDTILEWKFVTSSKVKIFQKIEIMKKKLGDCDDALLIYGAPKSSTMYVVKSPVLGLQKAFI